MFLKRIKDFRDEYDLTQLKLSSILGVSKSTYARWETDEVIIPLVHFNNLCNYFKVTMDYMVGLDNKNNFNSINTKLNKELIGKRLKSFRKEFNLTQTELAKEINTSHSTISAYENGKTMLLTAFAYDICKKYNISMDWLCGKK